MRNKGMQTFSREDGEDNDDCRENDNIVVRTRKSKRSEPEKTGAESRLVRKEKIKRKRLPRRQSLLRAGESRVPDCRGASTLYTSYPFCT